MSIYQLAGCGTALCSGLHSPPQRSHRERGILEQLFSETSVRWIALVMLEFLYTETKRKDYFQTVIIIFQI